GKDFNFTAHTITSITSTGAVSAKSTILVTTSSNVTVTGTYRSSYDQVVAPSVIAKSYSGFGVAGVTGLTEPIPVIIDASGATTITGATCAGTGTTLPRPNGKNVFN